MIDQKNIIKSFTERAVSLGGAPCSHFKVSGSWRSISWADILLRTRNLAANLIRLDLARGDRAIIFGNTRLEWTLADFAVMAAGGVVVPIYQSLNAERISHILKDSRPRFAIVEGGGCIKKFDEAVRMSGLSAPITVISMEHGLGLNSISSLAEKAGAEDLRALDERIDAISAGDVATYVYTSGTTGALKGVVITHGNIQAEVKAVEEVFDFRDYEIGLLWLPLAHVLGRMMEIFLLVHGSQTAYASSIEELPRTYLEIKPHFVCGVPRMLEKVHERAEGYIQNLVAPARALFRWALDVGKRRERLVQKSRRIPFFLAIQYRVAEMLIFRKLTAAFGGRLRCIICGGAKLSEEVAGFFHYAGIVVLEGYGLTETFGAATVNRFDDYHLGTVGKPVSGVELKLASDGEILIRGKIVFREYLNLPDETKKSFTDDGWFKTGDLGEYSRDGFLRITGRKKEMIITAGGKNVAPQLVESIMSESPYISNFMVYGDGRKYLVGLVALNVQEATSYLKNHGSPVSDGESISRHPMIVRLVQDHVDKANTRLASFETVKRFAIIGKSLSIDDGELTPTMKIRRDVVIEKYRDVLEALYQ